MGKRSRKNDTIKENRWIGIHIFCLFLSAGYLCVDFIPHFEKYADILYPQWFYLSILTLICAAFTFYYRDKFQPVFSLLINNSVVRIFFLFTILSAISLIQATNLPEGIIDLGRIVLTFFIFFFLSVFIYLLKDRVHILAKIIILILLYQSVEGLFEFFDKAGGFELKILLGSVAENFANKNIMAVTLLIKIPFILFILNSSKSMIWKTISAITLIPATCLIFILNARSAYVGFALIFLIYTAAQSLSFFRTKKKTSFLSNTVIVSMIILLTFLFTEQVLKEYSGQSRYGTVLERIKTININDSSGRILQWQEGLNLFKDNFVFGIGEGNFKIDFLKNWNHRLVDSLVYPRRLHNDFLEVAIETGIFGGLCYLSIFIFFLITCIRTLKRKNNAHAKELSFLSFLTAAVYSVDAFFNFPLERANMQVYFGFFLALNFVAYKGFNENTENNRPYKIPPAVWGLSILGLLGICYVNFTALRSSACQYNYFKDKERLTQNADDVARQFPSFPTIDFTGQPVRAIKAIYYIKEKRFQEALDVLGKGKNPSPYFLLEDLLKANIYTEMKQFDRAMKHALAGIEKGPRFYPFINKAIQIALKKGDLEAAIKTIHDYTQRTSDNPLAWVNYAELINIQTHDYNKVYKVLKDGLWCNPRNEILLKKMLSFIMSIKNKQEKLAALQSYNLMNTRSYSLAVRSCWIKDFNTAIKHISKLIDLPEFNNGHPEFFRGLCYLELGQKEKACADFQVSMEKNYLEAQKYSGQCSKYFDRP